MGITPYNVQRATPSKIYNLGTAIERSNQQEALQAIEELDFNKLGEISTKLRNALISSYTQDDVKYWKDTISGQDQQIYNTLRDVTVRERRMSNGNRIYYYF